MELSRYYPVHIYTECDLKTIHEGGASLSPTAYPHLVLVKAKCEQGSECERAAFASFKYYLAFENTNCTDYVTEKVWKSLAARLIPVVFQPALESYRRNGIPTRSLIHLQELEFSALRLAEHLRRVDEQFDLYYGYLKWTSLYLRVHDSPRFTEPHRMCHLCESLNKYGKSQYYTRIADFFSDECQKKSVEK